MANIITAAEFTELTGVSGDEVGEQPNSTRIRDASITKAQIEFFRDASRTFVSTDADYAIAQEAVAYLSAHKIATKKMALVGEEMRVSPYLHEYKRLLGLVTKGQSTDDSGASFQASVDMVRSQEDSADYVDDMPSE